MGEYNEKWTRDKFTEYRKLKRGGYTHEMLIEHFGEDIYHSGMYNRKLSWILIDFYGRYINDFLLSIGDTQNKKKDKFI